MDQFLNKLGIHAESKNIFLNPSAETCAKEGQRLKLCELTSSGAISIRTGKYTGRAAKDKYIVLSPQTEEKVWWNKNVTKMDLQTFETIKKQTIQFLNQQKDLYLTENSVGAHQEYNLSVRLVTTSPIHCLFAQHLFRKKIRGFKEGHDFTILHAPQFEVNAAELGTRSETVIVTNFEQKLIIIVGTWYAGEIKKSIFSMMNYLLPFQGVLPMHTGANLGSNGDVSLFFGLSGTGKTTLSTDEGKKLIGDDEHGLCADGVFNFEGGCYAKTYKLSKVSEPGIYSAIMKPYSILENVMLDERTKMPNFDDKSLGENGRASYPLEYIEERVPDAKGPIPNHIFFLTADAFGVLPPVSKLNKHQAMFYFISGYTSKVAGTEMGVVEPEATFSACFGAPFMTQKPEVYAHLLGDFLDHHELDVWLINTGWHKGPYGEGSRFPIATTRQIIRSIQSGAMDRVSTIEEPIFGLKIPEFVPGIPADVLRPKSGWKNPAKYDESAKKLAQMFKQNIKTYHGVSPEIINAGPA